MSGEPLIAAPSPGAPSSGNGSRSRGPIAESALDVDALAAAVAERIAHVAPAPGVLVDAEDAATILGVPASWVRAEARADRIPHVRLGRYVRFDPAELRAWWQERRRGPWRTGRRPVSGHALGPMTVDDRGGARGRDTAGDTNRAA